MKWKRASLLISHSLSPTVVFHPGREGLELLCVPEDILRLFYVCEKCGGGCAQWDRCQSINVNKNQCSWVLWKYFESVKLYKERSDVFKLHVFFQKQHIIISRPPFLSSFRQNLVVEGEHYPIILNTHFSQKVCVETKQDNAAVAVEKCRPPPLTRCLWRSGKSQVSTEKSIPCKQVRQLFPLMWSWEENRNSQKRDRIDFGFSVKILTCCWNGDSCIFLCDTQECRWLMSYVFMHEYLLKCENKTKFSCSTRPWCNKFMMQHTFPVILLLKITKVRCCLYKTYVGCKHTTGLKIQSSYCLKSMGSSVVW